MSLEMLSFIPPEQFSKIASFVQQLAENGSEAGIPDWAIALGVFGLIGLLSHYIGRKIFNFTEKFPVERLDEGIGPQVPEPLKPIKTRRKRVLRYGGKKLPENQPTHYGNFYKN